MKHCFFIFSFLIVCSTLLHGQDNILVYSIQTSNSSERTNEILQENEAYTSVHLVGINLDKILEYEEFTLQFGKRSIPVRKERIEARGINDFVFVGSNKEGSRILL